MWKWGRNNQAAKDAELEWQKRLPQPTDAHRRAAMAEPSAESVRIARSWPAANHYSGCFGEYVCETCLRVAKVIDVFGPQWTESLLWDLLNLDAEQAKFHERAQLPHGRHRADWYRHGLSSGRAYGSVNYLGGHGYSEPTTVDESPSADAVARPVGDSTE